MSNESGFYHKESFVDWSPPTRLCSGNPATRPSYPDDYCGIPPRIDSDSIKIIPPSDDGNVIIFNNGFITLSFNAIIDPQQGPLSRFEVHWGDDRDLVVGSGMKIRSSSDSPYVLYHHYRYWDLLKKSQESAGDYDIECFSEFCPNPNNPGEGLRDQNNIPLGDCCRIRPKIKVQDNWGWCNGGVTNNICPANTWERNDNQWVIVTARER